MASRSNEASSRLGRYMLQGWVLTDNGCSVAGCSIPLLRSKDNSKWMCALCDDKENPFPPSPSKSVVSQNINNNESDVFEDDDNWMPVETITSKEVLQKREKSDITSKLLGQNLLKGWTLLNETCPICEDVPLMKNLQAQLHCVICKKNFESDSKDPNTANVGKPIIENFVPDNDTDMKSSIDDVETQIRLQKLTVLPFSAYSRKIGFIELYIIKFRLFFFQTVLCVTAIISAPNSNFAPTLGEQPATLFPFRTLSPPRHQTGAAADLATMDMSLPMAISPASHFGNSYRRRMMMGSLGNSLGRSFGGSMGRSFHDIYHYGFVARSPAVQSPVGDHSHFALLEDKFCKDFACCGINLDSLHDLLQHFEECHVRVESDVDEEEDLPLFDLDEMETDMSDSEAAILRPQFDLNSEHFHSIFSGAESAIRLADVYSDSSTLDPYVIRKRYPLSPAALRKAKQQEHPATIPYVFDGPTQIISDTEMDEGMSPTSSILATGKSFMIQRHQGEHYSDDDEILDHGANPMFPPLPMPHHFDPHMMEQMPKIIRSGSDGIDIDEGKDKDDRPHKCKIAGCTKAYKNPGGLKYHMQHGHCEDTGDPEMNNIIHKPYQWYDPVPDCGKRYKNLNGLKYHIEHSHISLVTSVAVPT
ncbi:hypothetical protein HK096_002466 [Nowakowskiella sp. JEL0078]|nr:hypothetical protein HK096_002466 [Nowakowskiella sp. JEL0078]